MSGGNVIGVISDTHGLLRAEALEKLKGCSLVIHAGDIGSPDILAKLGQIADVAAVRGNVDFGKWTSALPRTTELSFSGRRIRVTHQLDLLDANPALEGIDVMIYGHSHRPEAVWKGDVLYLNPGSAGPRRFDLPVSMALLRFAEDGFFPELITLLP